MKKNIFLIIIISCFYTTQAQNIVNQLGLQISGKIGFNGIALPSRNNIYELADGVKKRGDFETKTSFTTGINFSIEFWPIYTPFLGYGITKEFSEGWLFGDSHSLQKFGHLFFLGTEKFKIISEYSFLTRRCTGYSFNQSNSQSYVEELNRSFYDNIKRTLYGIQIGFTEIQLKVGYFTETYEFIDKKSNGVNIIINKSNDYEIILECIFDHPIRGFIANGITVPTDLSQKDLFFYFSISKCFDFNRLYKNIF